MKNVDKIQKHWIDNTESKINIKNREEKPIWILN